MSFLPPKQQFQSTEGKVKALKAMLPGSLNVFEFKSCKFKTLKVLENEDGP